MGQGLSFSENFFYGEGECENSPEPTDNPTTVAQALVSMPDEEFVACCEHVGVNPESNEVINDLMEVIRQTDYCDGSDSPVTVYIDHDQLYSVTVYDET